MITIKEPDIIKEMLANFELKHTGLDIWSEQVDANQTFNDERFEELNNQLDLINKKIDDIFCRFRGVKQEI